MTQTSDRGPQISNKRKKSLHFKSSCWTISEKLTNDEAPPTPQKVSENVGKIAKNGFSADFLMDSCQFKVHSPSNPCQNQGQMESLSHLKSSDRDLLRSDALDSESESLNSNPSSITYLLCDQGQVLYFSEAQAYIYRTGVTVFVVGVSLPLISPCLSTIQQFTYL